MDATMKPELFNRPSLTTEKATMPRACAGSGGHTLCTKLEASLLRGYYDITCDAFYLDNNLLMTDL